MTAPAEWAERAASLLALGNAGVMVLIDRAHDSWIGDLGRALMKHAETFDVCVTAEELESSPVGGFVILAPEPAGSLRGFNLLRPVVRERKLRIAIWGRDEITARLPTEAPDFYDWISHRVECPPPRPAPFLVATLRAAAEAGRIGCVARPEPMLVEAAQLAWPEHGVAEIEAESYDELVEAIRAAGDRSLVIASALGAHLVGWALAEARRSGRVLCVDAPESDAWAGFWVASGELARLSWEARRFRTASVLLDLEHVALVGIELDHDVLRALAKSDDPGAAIASERPVASVPVARGDAPMAVLRARGDDPEAVTALAKFAAHGDPRSIYALARLHPAAFATLGTGPLTALASIEQRLRLEGPSADLADAAERFGEFDAAIRWERLAGLPPHRRVLAKAIHLANEGQIDEAAAELLAADAPPGPLEEAWTAYLGAILVASGKLEGTATLDPRSLPSNPSDAARGLVAFVLVVRGDFLSAFRLLSADAPIACKEPFACAAATLAWWLAQGRGGEVAAEHLVTEDPALGRPPDSAFHPWFEAERALARADAERAFLAASDGHARLARAFGSREHWLEGFLELQRARALSLLGQRERSLDSYVLAARIIRRTTGNREHPLALVADFEAAWTRAVARGQPRSRLARPLARLEAALFPEHREVKSARALLARLPEAPR